MKKYLKYRHARKGQKGAALLMAIAAAGLLTAIAVKLVSDAQREISNVGAYRDDFQARWAVRAPVALAIAALQQDEDGYTGFDQKWANLDEGLTVGRVQVRFRVWDESAKVNLNALGDKDAAVKSRTISVLKAVFQEREVDLSLIDYLADWVDSDDQSNSPGGEGSYYRSLSRPYGVKNLKLDSLSELPLVRGYTDKTLVALGFEKRADSVDLGLNEWFTVFSESRVNLNTAQPLILERLAGNIPDDFIQALIARRNEEPIKSVTEIKTMTGMNDQLFNQISPLVTVKSKYFSISSEAVSGKIRKRLIAVLKKEGENVGIVYWRIS